MTVGERIKQRRKELGLSVDEIAKKLGKNRATIYRYESNEIENMPLDVIEPLARVLNVSPAYLMGWEDKKELKGEYVIKEEIVKYMPRNIVMLPIVGVVRAGQPILATENIEGRFPIDQTLVNNDKEYFFLKVKGDSMNLEFKEGSLLLIEKTPCIENGEIGVVLVNNHEATVKKVIQNDNMITLIPMSSNPEHVPEMIDLTKMEVKIIGKVKMAIKKY